MSLRPVTAQDHYNYIFLLGDTPGSVGFCQLIPECYYFGKIENPSSLSFPMYSQNYLIKCVMLNELLLFISFFRRHGLKTSMVNPSLGDIDRLIDANF